MSDRWWQKILDYRTKTIQRTQYIISLGCMHKFPCKIMICRIYAFRTNRVVWFKHNLNKVTNFLIDNIQYLNSSVY